jgi:hypothetical protein
MGGSGEGTAKDAKDAKVGGIIWLGENDAFDAVAQVLDVEIDQRPR